MCLEDAQQLVQHGCKYLFEGELGQQLLASLWHKRVHRVLVVSHTVPTPLLLPYRCQHAMLGPGSAPLGGQRSAVWARQGGQRRYGLVRPISAVRGWLLFFACSKMCCLLQACQSRFSIAAAALVHSMLQAEWRSAGWRWFKTEWASTGRATR